MMLHSVIDDFGAFVAEFVALDIQLFQSPVCFEGI